MSIYDPCSGSGGMLIYARNHVADNGGNPTDLFLAGQEANGTTWSISKMNMLLHGIRDADLRNNDTLTDPEHIRDGELMRFDRVITNPPFSQNYDKSQLAHTERFRYGYTPEGGKKADLMFLQHMLAVLTHRRHRRHRHAPRRAVPRRRGRQDPPAHHRRRPARHRHRPRPQPLLRHRHPRRHPRPASQGIQAARTPRQGAVHQRRPRVHRGPSPELCSAPNTSRRSSPPTATSPTSTASPRSSPPRELAENDFNCNIRRYADNAPPPEPHDVRAHLHGGVPIAELDDAAPLLAQAGIDVDTFFTDRGDGYADWNHDIQTPARPRSCP